MVTTEWIIEASESPLTKPFYLCGQSRGRCFFLWSDQYEKGLKFLSSAVAHKWAKQHGLNCGFRIRSRKSK